MADKIQVQLDAYHWHEALDRASICMDMVDRFLLFHPVVESVTSLKERAAAAHSSLYELYQEIARLQDEVVE